MERPTGFEPATSSLGSWHSATELLPPVPPILVARRALSNLRPGYSGYFDSLKDISSALINSSLRAFQLSRLLAP